MFLYGRQWFVEAVFLMFRDSGYFLLSKFGNVKNNSIYSDNHRDIRMFTSWTSSFSRFSFGWVCPAFLIFYNHGCFLTSKSSISKCENFYVAS